MTAQSLTLILIGTFVLMSSLSMWGCHVNSMPVSPSEQSLEQTTTIDLDKGRTHLTQIIAKSDATSMTPTDALSTGATTEASWLNDKSVVSKSSDMPLLNSGSAKSVVGREDLVEKRAANSQSVTRQMSDALVTIVVDPVRDVEDDPDGDTDHISAGFINRQKLPTTPLASEITDVISKLRAVRLDVTATLNATCSTFRPNDLPPGITSCRDYAASSRDSLPCSGNWTESFVPTNATPCTILVNTAEALQDHNQLLQVITDLYRLNSSPFRTPCDQVIESSNEHRRCKAELAKLRVQRLMERTAQILRTAEIDYRRSTELTCQVDGSLPKKHAVAILWQVESELNRVLNNLLKVCERIDCEQGNTNLSCP